LIENFQSLFKSIQFVDFKWDIESFNWYRDIPRMRWKAWRWREWATHIFAPFLFLSNGKIVSRFVLWYYFACRNSAIQFSCHSQSRVTSFLSQGPIVINKRLNQTCKPGCNNLHGKKTHQFGSHPV
jgi:hypothetical protein